MAQYPDPQWKRDQGSRMVAIFDPCASRYDKPMQESVRSLLTTTGYRIEELTDHVELTKCCSYGGHIKAVNHELVENITENRMKQSRRPFVTYCSNCRDTFASSGKESDHLLNLIFDLKIDSSSVTNLSQRWKNRVALKNALTGKTDDETKDGDSTADLKLEISSELRKTMNEQLIMDEDIMAVIKNAEETGNFVVNNHTTEVTAHLTIGLFTYWVTYEKKESGYQLKKVYVHRMTIDGEFKK
jgi:hypothetical protein